LVVGIVGKVFSKVVWCEMQYIVGVLAAVMSSCL